MRELNAFELEDVSGGFIVVACAIAGVLIAAFGAGVALGAADDTSFVCKAP